MHAKNVHKGDVFSFLLLLGCLRKDSSPGIKAKTQRNPWYLRGYVKRDA